MTKLTKLARVLRKDRIKYLSPYRIDIWSDSVVEAAYIGFISVRWKIWTL